MNSPNARAAIERVRRRPGWRLDRRLGLALLACFVAAEIGIAAYLIGASSGIEPSAADAIQRQAFQTSFDLARAEAAAEAKLRGERAGQRAGQQAGGRAGAQFGARRGS
ncbi:MAG: hypothetical protein M3Q53_06445, partial [Actinomycetota bacterium]|nr:hypothetical protein [Actinomycetota bacterium]